MAFFGVLMAAGGVAVDESLDHHYCQDAASL
jgi:hypothetical protein